MDQVTHSNGVNEEMDHTEIVVRQELANVLVTGTPRNPWDYNRAERIIELIDELIQLKIDEAIKEHVFASTSPHRKENSHES